MNDSTTIPPIIDGYQWNPVNDTENNGSKPFLSDVDLWKTLERFAGEHKQFQLSQLRWLLSGRKGNGLDKAVRKIGKRIYINEQLFAEWMFEKTGNE